MICSHNTTTISALTTKQRTGFIHFRVILSAALAFLHASLPAQSEPDYKFFKGRVKSCNEQCYKAKVQNGTIEKSLHTHNRVNKSGFEWHYDSTEKKTEQIVYANNGETVKRRIHYTYDGYNNLAEVRVLSKLGVLIKSTRYLNTFDSTGLLLGCYVSYSDRSQSAAFSYSYSSSGMCYEYFLPAKGFPAKQLASREFDSARNVTKYWSYTQNGNLTGYAILTYDSLRNKILEELYDKHGFNYLNYAWKFDGGHDPVRHEICKPNSTSCESWTYKYEYDKHGNWIKRTDYRNGKPVYIKERQFIYF